MHTLLLVIENMDLKEKLYTELGATCQPDTIFASNTSSLSIGEMAQFSGRPEKFVGVHFFNPVQVREVLGCSFRFVVNFEQKGFVAAHFRHCSYR